MRSFKEFLLGFNPFKKSVKRRVGKKHSNKRRHGKSRKNKFLMRGG
jgi:hypothetical protein